MRKKWLFLAPLALLGILLVSAIGGGIVMQLWNGLLPSIFGFPAITFWQALGLLVLCRILFGGLGRHGCSRSPLRRRLDERFGHMSPEDRERFRDGLLGRREASAGPSQGQ